MFFDLLISSLTDLGPALPAYVSGFVIILLSTIVAPMQLGGLIAVLLFIQRRLHADYLSGPPYRRNRPLCAERQQREPT